MKWFLIILLIAILILGIGFVYLIHSLEKDMEGY
jgi:hypothetical protein